MPINGTIITLLSILAHSLGPKMDGQLTVTPKKIIVEPALLTINQKDILLLDTINLQLKLSSQGSAQTVSIEAFSAFIKAISNSIVRLNHVGVGYYCDNIPQEINTYKTKIANSGFNLFTEKSTTPHQEWFFIVNKKMPEAPKIELVLTDDSTLYQGGNPHFQIDLDTNLTTQELHTLTKKYFGKNLLDWELNIPPVGVVLAMGILGEVNGVKVVLGLGTKNRVWRLEELTEV